MYTRCPTCSTCFRVTERHLAIAKGKVRCGQCKLAFNAPEHAIDDLPINRAAPATNKISPPPIQTKKPDVKPTKIKKTLIAETRIEKEQNKIIVEEPKEEVSSESFEMKTPSGQKENPHFDADATLMADLSFSNKDDVEQVDLDSPSEKNNDDNNFNLDEAIDAFTKDTDEDEIDFYEKPLENKVLEKDRFIPSDNNNDVFNTDAYNATSADSVKDILDEMEGQLSLEIKSDNSTNYDPNLEFDFLQLDDSSKLENEEKNDFSKTIETEEDIKNKDEFDFILDDEELDVIEENKNSIDEHELFDQIDLSDFEDSDTPEEIILEEESSFESFEIENNEDSIPLQLKNDLQRLQNSPQRRFHPLIGTLSVVILLVLSFAQLAYFRAHELVQLIPSARPTLESFCESIGCQYSGPSDLKKIQLISRDVRLHPKEKKALLISAAMINNANFDQPYPDIHIRLSDISGNVVAERIFNPKIYMGKISNPFLLMKSKTPVHINFEVVDPGKDAINFEFTFL